MYQVLQLGKVVGSVQVETKGLYRFFSCKCKPKVPGKYHLYAKIGEWEYNLGLCVPEEGSFVLRRSIPIKEIPHGDFQFLLIKPVGHSEYMQVVSHQPFSWLMALKAARLVNQNGQLFIVLSVAQAQQDSDQSQEHHYKLAWQ